MSLNSYFFDKPFVYSSGIMSIKTILSFWLIGIFSSSILFFYYDRPTEAWLTRMVPVHAIFLVLYLLAFVFTNLVHQAILELVGVDCSEINSEFAITNLDPRYALPQTMEIFPSHELFSDMQKSMVSTVRKNNREKLAISLGFLLIILVHLSDKIQGTVGILGNEPNAVEASAGLSIIVTIIQVISQSLLAAGAISGLFLIIVLVRTISKLGQIGTVINELDEYIIHREGEEHVHGKYSLKSFKEKTNVIPHTLLPIILLLFLVILLSGSGILYYILLRGGNLLLTYMTVFFMLAFLIIDIFLFFFPQLSLHRIMKDSKDKMTEMFDQKRDEKKILLITHKSNLTLEQKQELWIDIKFLNYLIDELDEFLTWPFNYRQLLTLMFSIIIITLLTLNIFSFLELITRIIDT